MLFRDDLYKYLTYTKKILSWHFENVQENDIKIISAMFYHKKYIFFFILLYSFILS